VKQHMLTAKDVADHLQIGLSSVYKLARTGQLPASKVLNKWRFELADVESFAGSGISTPPERTYVATGPTGDPAAGRKEPLQQGGGVDLFLAAADERLAAMQRLIREAQTRRSSDPDLKEMAQAFRALADDITRIGGNGG
jgi:excisionase family DNA binding protein